MPNKPNGVPTTFGQRLRYLRAKRGLKQADLARRIRRPQSSISSYEGDERSPSLEVLQALALALNCPIAVLVGERGDDDDANLPPQSWQHTIIELSGYVNQLPERDLDELMGALRVLVALRLKQVQQRRRPDAAG